MEKIQQTLRRILRGFNFFQPPVNKSGTLSCCCSVVNLERVCRNLKSCPMLCQLLVSSEAALIRKEYEESSTKLSKLQSRISSLTEKLKHDFGQCSIVSLYILQHLPACFYKLTIKLNIAGTEKEFYSLYDHCFESKQNKLGTFTNLYFHCTLILKVT